MVTEAKLIEVRIDALAYGGACIGEILSPPDLKGKKALVRETVPGEEVQARIALEQKNIVEADLVGITKASANRCSPPCPYFGRCGGCDFQQMDLPYQREQKLKMVQSMLERQAGLVPEQGLSLLGEELPGYHYRARVTLHLAPEGRLGFYKAKSGEVVEIERCLLASETINKALGQVRPFARELAAWIGKISIEEHGAEAFFVFELREEAVAKVPALLEAQGPLKPRFPHFKVFCGRRLFYCQEGGQEISAADTALRPFGHFSQVNPEGNRLLINTVVSEAEGACVTDLYAGDGNFSLPLGAAGKSVEAVEIDPVLVKFGRHQAGQQGLAEVKFCQSSCERYLRERPLQPTVVLDPPRSGAKELVPQFGSSRAQRVVYISCNLPSLARDAKLLCADGFKLTKVYLVDMFSQTHHLEMVAVFRRS